MKKHLTWILFLGYFIFFLVLGLVFYFFYFDKFLSMGATPATTAELVQSKIYYTSGGSIHQISPEYLKIGAQTDSSEAVQGTPETLCPQKNSLFYLKDGNVYKRVDQAEDVITNFTAPKTVSAFSTDKNEQTIAYEVNSDIYASKATGVNLIQLTSDQRNTGPVISPDGTQVAYIKSQEGIYVSRVDQNGETKLLNTAENISLLCWR